jgi:hypothetical protein
MDCLSFSGPLGIEGWEPRSYAQDIARRHLFAFR